MAVVPPLNNFLGPEGDTVTVAEQLLNTALASTTCFVGVGVSSRAQNASSSDKRTQRRPWWLLAQCRSTDHGPMVSRAEKHTSQRTINLGCSRHRQHGGHRRLVATMRTAHEHVAAP